MRLSDILSADRIHVDADGTTIRGKAEALNMLSVLLAPVAGGDAAGVEQQFVEREQLQSTGIGEGVAIPHAAVDGAEAQAAALVLCRNAVPFDSIDGAPVSIVFGVVGPRRATGEHLRALARISRLLRNPATRAELIAAPDAAAAWALIRAQDDLLGG